MSSSTGARREVMDMGFSQAEIAHFEQGPFPGRIDPWAETARYFRSIHSEMISALLASLREPLLDLGYVAGRETSLQIAEGREPDIHIRREQSVEHALRWNYELAAAEVLAEPGIAIEDAAEFEALHIRELKAGDLVTVVEIVSPGNKTRDHEMTAYRERRSRLMLERGVNVVEIDPTRSIKRLTNNSETRASAYHIAVFLPGEAVRIIGIPFQAPLSRLAVPLRGTVIPVELHDAYSRAYRQTTTAWHIHHEGRYTEDDLPFPTVLTDSQRHEVLEAVERWQQELARLRA
jgi:hypothetical protein